MRFNDLDLNLLVALDALLDERSITRAADRLHVTQPAMSISLRRLRTYFEDDLLVRVGGKLELTPRAESLRDAVSDILMRVNTSIETQPEFDCTISDRVFHIFASDYTQTVLMPFALARATRQRSTARFNLLPLSFNPMRALERGESDILIIPGIYASPENASESLSTDRFVCVVWNQSSHARTGLSIERYANASHAVMQPTNSDEPSLESMLVQRHGISRRVEVTTYSLASLPSLVVGTEMVATVHAMLARRLQPQLPVTLLPLPLPMPPFEQAMHWHPYSSSDPGLVWLRGLMHEAARDAQTLYGDPAR
jgi:LysR family transcriptional regulator, nod-box dependent transcriptional activator